MQEHNKTKIKIVSSGMLQSFGYNIRTPAVVELYPNQIAILKATGVVFQDLPKPKIESLGSLGDLLKNVSLEDNTKSVSTKEETSKKAKK